MESGVSIRQDGTINHVCMRKILIASLVAFSSIFGSVSALQVDRSAYPSAVDHLVYATPDLQRGIERIEGLLGVRAAPGGQHPGRGTRNALVALGPAAYLEIIGPDPEQPTPKEPRPFGIDGLREPRLMAWASKGTDLEQIASTAQRHGVKLGPVIAGSRRRADGVMLSWRYTDPRTVVANGIVPFFIDWGKTPHPSATAAPGASLIACQAVRLRRSAAASLAYQAGACRMSARPRASRRTSRPPSPCSAAPATAPPPPSSRART
jgi:hypothetical protein